MALLLGGIRVLEGITGRETLHEGLENDLVLEDVGGIGEELGRTEALEDAGDEVGLQLHVEERGGLVAFEGEAGEANL
jgi:hypothetical protein